MRKLLSALVILVVILVIGGAQGVPIRVRIPRAPLFPFDASKAVLAQGKVVLSCTVNRVPPELVGVTVKP